LRLRLGYAFVLLPGSYLRAVLVTLHLVTGLFAFILLYRCVAACLVCLRLVHHFDSCRVLLRYRCLHIRCGFCRTLVAVLRSLRLRLHGLVVARTFAGCTFVYSLTVGCCRFVAIAVGCWFLCIFLRFVLLRCGWLVCYGLSRTGCCTFVCVLRSLPLLVVACVSFAAAVYVVTYCRSGSYVRGLRCVCSFSTPFTFVTGSPAVVGLRLRLRLRSVTVTLPRSCRVPFMVGLRCVAVRYVVVCVLLIPTFTFVTVGYRYGWFVAVTFGLRPFLPFILRRFGYARLRVRLFVAFTVGFAGSLPFYAVR